MNTRADPSWVGSARHPSSSSGQAWGEGEALPAGRPAFFTAVKNPVSIQSANACSALDAKPQGGRRRSWRAVVFSEPVPSSTRDFFLFVEEKERKDQ